MSDHCCHCKNPSPEKIKELQDALTKLSEDVAWKYEIVVLPPGDCCCAEYVKACTEYYKAIAEYYKYAPKVPATATWPYTWPYSPYWNQVTSGGTSQSGVYTTSTETYTITS